MTTEASIGRKIGGRKGIAVRCWIPLSVLGCAFLLSACIAAIKGETRGVIVSGVLIAASFYIRQNNVIFALYPLLGGADGTPRAAKRGKPMH
jgi:hypothetical protein